MGFQFVALDNGRVDEAARKRIRSHVMRGKNAGRILPPRHRRECCESSRPMKAQEATESQLSRYHQDFVKETATYEPPLFAQFTDSLTYFEFPRKLEPSMKASIQQFIHVNTRAMFPPEVCHPPPDLARGIWFEYIQKDAAFFHSTLAMSEVLADSLRGHKDTSPLALQHLSNSYACIARKLQIEKVPSDATLAAVVSMAIHEDLRGQPERGQIHMDALQQIVQLRGGIDGIGSHQALSLKLCRADIEYAIHTGSRPFFYRDQFPYEMVNNLQRESGTTYQRSLNVASVCEPDSIIGLVIDDLNCIAWTLNRNADVRLDPYGFQEVLMSVCYRLLTTDPLLGYSSLTTYESAISLGLLSLMTTILFQNGHPHRISYALLAEKLRVCLENPHNAGLYHEPMMLWLSFVGGISVFDSETDNSWLVSHIKNYLRLTNVASWQDVLDNVCRFPWIRSLHDKPAKKLWEKVVLT